MRFFTITCSLVLACCHLLPAQTVNYAERVHFSQPGGRFDGPVSVELSCATPGAIIKYTLDGSVPDTQSMTYAGGALVFDSTSVLRAAAFKLGILPSPVVSHTYFVGLSHVFPVVSLIFEPAAFFDSLTGIYIHYDQDLEAQANIEFFEAGADTAAFNQLVEIEIQGTGSAAQPQKSLEIKAKSGLGQDEIPYAVFPELPFGSYKRLVLRNGGQDWCVLQFRDEFATSLLHDCADLGNIVDSPALYQQAWRPSVVYLNGRYWGIHNVRERMNRFYVRQHFGWAQDDFDMLENYGDVSSGDSIEWFLFFNYMWQTGSGFENDSIFKNIKQRIDYQNFIDYAAFNIYLENEDWPGNNVLRFRHRSQAGKWRWMSYDLDFTFGLFQPGGGWNTGDPSPDALSRLLDSTSLLWPNPDWATLLFRRCWQNAAFRYDFSNRLADWLNTAFLPQRVCERLDAFKGLYQPEIIRHYERWWFGNFEFMWLQNIEKVRYFAQNRPDFVRQEVLDAAPEAYGSAVLTVNVSPAGAGRIRINTVHPNENQFPWSGIYFKGIPVPLCAVANPGYKFIGWSDPALGTADSVRLTLTDSILVVAYFQLEDTTTDAVSDLASLSFDVFPNPARGSITAQGEVLKFERVQVQIIDEMGQVVVDRQCVADASGQIGMATDDLPAGTYFLKIASEISGTGLRRFVIGR